MTSPDADVVRDALASFDVAADPRFWSLGPRPAPIDIACELCRAMDTGRFVKRGKTFVQTVYSVLLSPEDIARFDDRRRELTATLKDVLIWWSKRNGYALPGEVRVRLVPSDALRPGQLGLEAGLRSAEAAKLGRARSESE